MNPLLIAQIIVSILITGIILIQNQGGGLGSAFGGSNFTHTKRGIEKSLFNLTIILTGVFIVLSIANLL